MFAVIKTGGKQYSVEQGNILKIEKISGKKGDSYVFDKVLIIGDSSKQTLGEPIIKGASVEATILDQIRDKKILVFKKIRRQNYRRTKGHRRYLTVLKINKILNKGLSNNKKNKEIKLDEDKKTKINKKSVTKKSITKKTASNKATKKKAVKKKITKTKLKKDR